MPDFFTPYTLKGVTLRNRIAMSPMTMYRSEHRQHARASILSRCFHGRAGQSHPSGGRNSGGG